MGRRRLRTVEARLRVGVRAAACRAEHTHQRSNIDYPPRARDGADDNTTRKPRSTLESAGW
jgi:hypothetical protein